MTRHIFIIAGEESGDALAASLMQDITSLSVEPVLFPGIGGNQMTALGLQSIFPMTDLSVMGLAEVVKHLPRLYKRFHQVIDAIKEQKPDLVITVDAQDFSSRVGKKIKQDGLNIPVLHYVAPTVWAWRPGRAKKVAQYLSGLMCLFPFEPPYFKKHELSAEFVGHPLIHQIGEITEEQKKTFCTTHGLDRHKPILCVLPGSRNRELDSLLPVLTETIARLKHYDPSIQVIVPTLAHLTHKLDALRQQAYVFVPADRAEKYTAFATSTLAIHASGTVALELALCQTPMVTVYKVSTLSGWIGKILIKTPFANLVNILLNYPVVPELIQDQANVETITSVAQALLAQETLRDLQKESLHKIADHLKENAPQSAARFVLSYLK